MYLDLSACARCRGTESSLEEAISETASVLEMVGVEVILRKTHVRSERQARQLGLKSSPTILLNGRDIQEELKESLCDSCLDLTGGEPCDCRIWTYEGREYSAPPAAMIMDAIFREVYGGWEKAPPRQAPEDIPDNLMRFFAARRKRFGK
jgi:hypothetical protein